MKPVLSDAEGDTERPDVLARIGEMMPRMLERLEGKRGGGYYPPPLLDDIATLVDVLPALRARLTNLEAMQARAQVWHSGVSEGEIADPDGELLCALNYILHGTDTPTDGGAE